MVDDPNTVDPDSVGVLIDWFRNRYGFSRNPDQDTHDVLAHLVLGFSPNYPGELYAGVPDMVFRHSIPPSDGRGFLPFGRRPSLEDVQQGLVRIHNALSGEFLNRRYDPWSHGGRTTGISQLMDAITSHFTGRFCREGERPNYAIIASIHQYYERHLIPPEKRLPPEIFEYAEENFGSMPPRSEEETKKRIVDSEEMEQLFPQYAAGMYHFCSIIDDYYGRDHRRDYEQGVPQEIRDFITAHEQEILTIFEETERRVEKARSSATTLEPLSPERIEELYNLCVKVDEHIKNTIGKYPHQMTSKEIRELPMGFLSEIREKFRYRHDERPSSAGGADDPRLEFACLLADREAYRG
jgi:hypothetical protein